MDYRDLDLPEAEILKLKRLGKKLAKRNAVLSEKYAKEIAWKNRDEDADFREDWDFYSDTFKDVNGFRPKGYEFKNFKALSDEDRLKLVYPTLDAKTLANAVKDHAERWATLQNYGNKGFSAETMHEARQNA